MGGMPAGHYTASGGPIAIPDNSATGVESTIQVADHGTISSLSVTVDITHSYRGDLKVVLVHGDRQHSLHDRAGGSQDNLRETFVVDAFDGEDVNGAWKLVVTDTARADTGSLVTWSMDATF
jgi:subtilisin-like proprotein convertase family protein